MTTIPALPLNNIQNVTENSLLRFGASLRGERRDNVWTPRNAHEAEAMLGNQNEDATPAAVFCSPSTWQSEYQLLTRNVLQKDDFVALHYNDRTFHLKGKVKLACFVRNVPRLSALKAAIQADQSNSSSYDVWNPSTSSSKPKKSRHRVIVEAPQPTIWAVNGVRDSEIYVFDALSGCPLLCFRDLKYNVGITAISHAPFMGLINKQLQVIPVEQPLDLLPLKEQHLINSDYMWVGFSDGAIRLFPANHEQFFQDFSVSDSDKMPNDAYETHDIAFEVPKFHAGAIVSIARSPSLEKEDTVELSTRTRLSTTMKAMRSATEATKQEFAQKRDHLSLVCTASVDSVVVVWDVRKIYQTLQQMREQARKERRATSVSTSSAATFAQEVSTVEQLSRKGKPIPPGLKLTSKLRCILVKVRPLLRLKGGVPGITCLNWVSSLITTEGYRPEREPEKVTRDPVEPSAPEMLKARREVQTTTRFERREEQRRALDLTEEEMCDVEKELRVLLPPLALEKPQSIRINLLFAGDSVGTVHVWNLDEELQRNPTDEIQQGSVLEAIPSSVQSNNPPKSGGASSPMKGSTKKVSSMVQTAPVHSPHASKSKGRTTELTKKPTGYVSAKPPTPHRAEQGEQKQARKTSVVVPPVNLSRLDGMSARSSPRQATPRMSSLQLLAAQRQGNVPRKVRPCDPVSQPKPVAKRRTLTAGDAATPSEKNKGVDASEDAPLLRYPLSAKRSVTIKDVPPLLSGDTFHTPVKKSSNNFSPTGGSNSQRLSDCYTTPGKQLHGALTPTPKSGALRSPGGFRSPATPMGQIAPSSSPVKTPSKVPPSPSKALSRLEQRNASVSMPRKDLPSSTSRRATSTTIQSTPSKGAPTTTYSARSRALSTARSHASPSPRTSMSPTTSSSPSRRGPSTANQLLSRSAKCRIEFTGGVAVMGMAAQYPSRITVTMRRIPDPVEQERSLLEDPDPLEVEKRSLENSFEELNEQKALFIFFQYLQLHISVEGAVLNFRFVPEWTAKDSDGRQLFKQRDFSPVMKRFENEEEMPLERFLILSGFNLHIRKLVLDAHSQPICGLYLDRKRGHLWASRNDGLLSLFSVDSKYIVTRVPHPSATNALGPPDPTEWTKQLQQYLHDSNFMTASRRLQKHKETLDYGSAARFSGFVPFCRTVQQSFAMVYQSREGSARKGSWRPTMEVCLLDGRANLSAMDRKHERHLNVFVNYLKMCRQNANSVRKAQREFYLLEEERVTKNLERLGKCNAGLFAGLIPLRQAFHKWKLHLETFGFMHHARGQRVERQKRLSYTAEAMLKCNKKIALSLFFSKWKRWTLLRRIDYSQRCIVNMMRFSQKRLGRPTSKMMACMASVVKMKRSFRVWKQMVLDRRRADALAPIIFPPAKNADASPLLMSARMNQSAPSTSRERSFKNTWVDDEVDSFLYALSFLYQSRFSIISFFDSHSHDLVEEAWLPVLQNAEAEASSDDIHDKKVAVLCYGLIPLLQGFLSSSESVLANIHDSGVKEDVFSMMHGMLLCLDYILEDPEETLVELILSGKVAASDYEENKIFPDSRPGSLLFRTDTALRGVIHHYLLNVLIDDESANSISDIAKDIDNLQSLLSFIQANVNRS